jgi:DeoR family fructose operon transcriptional repressor
MVYPVERQRTIVEHARLNGRIEVLELSTLLQVAPETIRRDLAELEKRGLIRRVHGGGLPIESAGFEGTLTNRTATRVEEKERIARAALPMALEADSFFLDEGSTGASLANLIVPDRPVTVVTSSLPIACALSVRPNVDVISLGGRVRGSTQGVYDHWAANMLRGLVIDVAFLGTNGITLKRGLSCPNTAVAAVKMAAIQASRRSVLLVDHTKFGADSFAVFAAVTDIDVVITDSAAPKKDVEALRRAGVEVIRA